MCPQCHQDCEHRVASHAGSVSIIVSNSASTLVISDAHTLVSILVNSDAHSDVLIHAHSDAHILSA